MAAVKNDNPPKRLAGGVGGTHGPPTIPLFFQVRSRGGGAAAGVVVVVLLLTRRPPRPRGLRVLAILLLLCTCVCFGWERTKAGLREWLQRECTQSQEAKKPGQYQKGMTVKKGFAKGRGMSEVSCGNLLCSSSHFLNWAWVPGTQNAEK